MTQAKQLLIIFTRNPELGKCKTRLAKTVGNTAALNIYKFLLQHTVTITQDLKVKKAVYYSIKIRENDIWDDTIYLKENQKGKDLGERMHHAFSQGFKQGFTRIIIIGTDMYNLSKNDLELAFSALDTKDVVIGPAEDGGYYLLGMKTLHPKIFKHKHWGTNTVLNDTIKDLEKTSIHYLEQRNDVDYFEDIKDIEVFHPFFPKSLLEQ